MGDWEGGRAEGERVLGMGRSLTRDGAGQQSPPAQKLSKGALLINPGVEKSYEAHHQYSKKEKTEPSRNTFRFGIIPKKFQKK